MLYHFSLASIVSDENHNHFSSIGSLFLSVPLKAFLYLLEPDSYMTLCIFGGPGSIIFWGSLILLNI